MIEVAKRAKVALGQLTWATWSNLRDLQIVQEIAIWKYRDSENVENPTKRVQIFVVQECMSSTDIIMVNTSAGYHALANASQP